MKKQYKNDQVYGSKTIIDYYLKTIIENNLRIYREDTNTSIDSFQQNLPILLKTRT